MVEIVNVGDIDEQLDAYWDVLCESDLTDKSMDDYYYFAYCFVRWMKGDFDPGANVEGRRRGRRQEPAF